MPRTLGTSWPLCIQGTMWRYVLVFSCVSKFLLLYFRDFFIQLDQECGPLTLHSSLKDLVYYTRRGLRTLSASPSEEAANVAPFFHPPGPSEHDHKSAMKWWGRGQLGSQNINYHWGIRKVIGSFPFRAYLDMSWTFWKGLVWRPPYWWP